MTQLNETTRIVLKFYIPALGYALCLQRKRRFGWRTVAWNPPSTYKGFPCSEIEEWLFKQEHRNKNRKSEKQIGKEIMSKCWRWERSKPSKHPL